MNPATGLITFTPSAEIDVMAVTVDGTATIVRCTLGERLVKLTVICKLRSPLLVRLLRKRCPTQLPSTGYPKIQQWIAYGRLRLS